jgi:hypothetical protein
MRLNGRVAVVTGAGRGLGEAIALRFAAEGAAVALNDMDATTAAATVAQIEKQGGRATAVIGSVTDEANVQALIERAVQAFGGVDILVNNAGITRDKLLRDMSVEDWGRGAEPQPPGDVPLLQARDATDGLQGLGPRHQHELARPLREQGAGELLGLEGRRDRPHPFAVNGAR